MEERNATLCHLVGRVVVSLDQRPVTLPSSVSKISLSCWIFHNPVDFSSLSFFLTSFLSLFGIQTGVNHYKLCPLIALFIRDVSVASAPYSLKELGKSAVNMTKNWIQFALHNLSCKSLLGATCAEISHTSNTCLLNLSQNIIVIFLSLLVIHKMLPMFWNYGYVLL